MRAAGWVVRAGVVAAAALALGGCGGKYGPHGDRGLPPPPANLSYPNVYRTEPDRHHGLKSAEEQKRLQADLLAHKPQPRKKR